MVSVRLDDATREELESVARSNDRTLSAEVRRAIRRYLETQRAAA